MTVGLEFGKDEIAVHRDLKPALVRRDQRRRFDQMLEILQQFIRQAHGSIGVMSNRAVGDLDL